MKVKVGGPLSHMWTNGLIESWTGAVVEVPDDDEERVAYFHQLVDIGDAEMLEDPHATDGGNHPGAVADKVMAAPKKTASTKAASTE